MSESSWSGAEFDSTRQYRYRLWRRWRGGGRTVLWIMLNPSTADEYANDRTIAKCIKFSQRWGFDGMEIVNLFAWRATDPRALKPLGVNAIGPANDDTILSAAARAHYVMAAWGAHGTILGRAARVMQLCRAAGVALQCMQTTQTGQPMHPLYLPADLLPKQFL